MDFYIRKDSTLPILVMEQVNFGEGDYESLNNLLSNCAVTFSMVNIDTGVYKIANVEAGVVAVPKVHTDKATYPYEYFLFYEWKEKDVDKVGTYKAEFKINFIDPTCKSLTVPIMDDLYVHIGETMTKTSVFYK